MDELMSGIEMQRLIVYTMKELMWVVSDTVVMTHEQKQQLVDKAYQLALKFESDFVVN